MRLTGRSALQALGIASPAVVLLKAAQSLMSKFIELSNPAGVDLALI